MIKSVGKSAWALVFVATVMVSAAHAQTTFYFPQIADGTFGGGFFTTTVFVTNNGSMGAANVTLTFTSSSGQAFNVGFVDSQSQPVGSGNVVTLTSLAPGQSRKLVSTAASPLTVGFATVTSDIPIVATAVFSQFSGVPGSGTLLSEAAVSPANAGTTQAVFVDESGNFRTAVAYANISETLPANLTFSLQSINTGGVPTLTTAGAPLAARNHRSIFVDELFSTGGQTDPLAIGHVGTMSVTSDVAVPLVSLRFSGSLFTSVPPYSIVGLISPIQDLLADLTLPTPLAMFARVLGRLGTALG